MLKLSPDQALPCAQALATLLTALATSLFILSIAGKDANEAMAAAYKITGVVAILGVILIVMSALNVSNAVENAKGLSLLLLALSTSMVILSTFGGDVGKKAIISAYLMSGVLVILGLVLAEMTALNVSNAMENAKALSLLIMSLSAACVLLSFVGLLGAAAIIGVGSLAALIVAIGGIMYGIGALAQYQPSMDEFLDHGIVTLGKIGEGLGNLIGSFVKMFAETAASALPSIATSLSMFMDNLMPFVTACKTIGSGTFLIDGIAAITKAVLLLTAANFLSGIASLISLGTSFTGLSEKFTAIGEAMAAFSNATTGVNSEQIKASAEAAASLAEVFKSFPNNGKKIQAFGTSMKNLSDTLSEVEFSYYDSAATALNTITEAVTNFDEIGRAHV